MLFGAERGLRAEPGRRRGGEVPRDAALFRRRRRDAGASRSSGLEESEEAGVGAGFPGHPAGSLPPLGLGPRASGAGGAGAGRGGEWTSRETPRRPRAVGPSSACPRAAAATGAGRPRATTSGVPSRPDRCRRRRRRRRRVPPSSAVSDSAPPLVLRRPT